MLIIFEGPDGVGKTTLAKMLAERIGATYYAFPGQEAGSLGQLVYELHHRTLFPAMDISDDSLQLLHIAAHINALHTRLIPWLQEGRTVVLDRFYWSTLVYGLAYGLRPAFLERIIGVERIVWAEGSWLHDALMLCIMRGEPFTKKDDPKAQERWSSIASEYIHQFRKSDTHWLANRHIVYNEGLIDTTYQQIINLVNQTKQFQVH